MEDIEKENWQNVKSVLENELSAIGYDLWIKPLTILDEEEDYVILESPSQTAKNQIIKCYSENIKNAIIQKFSNKTNFKIITTEEVEDYLKNKKNTPNAKILEKQQYAQLNPKYTFENFVVGKCNNYAFTACKSVADNLAHAFNPLFIYGGVGLGKTHLLHAIGNYVLTKNPELKVCYATCEKFTNDYLESINKTKDRTPYSFREKYRNVDVLLIDDIQFISKKVSTQEEFFHTFNDLFQNGKQIILSSDRSPKDIEILEDRLRSRFAMGLIQDLQQPDYETRLAILEKKTEIEKYNINSDVLNYIAEKVDTNIRELEGVLSKVVFFASLTGKAVATISDAYEALKEQIQENTQGITIDSICECVCKYYNVSKDELIGKKKTKEIVDPRQVCIYIITEILDTPLTSIGNYFGGRDHTTIMHARDKIANNVKTNTNLKNIISDIKSMIKHQ